MSTRYLDQLLNPRSLAVVGASERDRSPGHALLKNLLEGGYQGVVHAVNPRYDNVMGLPCYRDLQSLPNTPDLIIAVSPERTLKRLLKQCEAVGAHLLIVMSAVKDSEALHRRARRHGVRLLGPWSAGLIRPVHNLNATVVNHRFRPGHLAVLTESAALGAAMLDWAEQRGIGFSTMLSAGRESDISAADLLDVLAEDPHTRAIIVYIDRIQNTRRFYSAAAAAARRKPVVMMKSTQFVARYCDVLEHSTHVYSNDPVFESAMRRAGVVRIRTFQNLFGAATILASGARTRGDRLAIIANGAAPALLACERAQERGYSLPHISDTLKKALQKIPGGAVHGPNPFSLRSDRLLPTLYRGTIERLAASGEYDAIIVLFVPDGRNDPEAVAGALREAATHGIPLIACWMGEHSVSTARTALASSGQPVFTTPEAAVDGFSVLHRYYRSQQELLQFPNPASRQSRADTAGARRITRQALAEGKRVLGPQATRQLLSAIEIDTLPAVRAIDLESALQAADSIGYPVALKLVSPNLMHRAAVAEVALDIASAQALERAWHAMRDALRRNRPEAEFAGVLIEAMWAPQNSRSLCVDVRRDPYFGPVISVGITADWRHDAGSRAIQLPPLNRFLIDRMLEHDTLAEYLGHYRYHAPVALEPLKLMLRRVSELICEVPEIFGLHIRPLKLGDGRAVVLDATVIVERSHSIRPYTHLAIHPYPWQWIRSITLKNGQTVQLRPIRPSDGDLLRELVRSLSEQTRWFRFMHTVKDLTPHMLAQFTRLDYDRQMAFVAVPQGEDKLLGVARYAVDTAEVNGEFAVVIADAWQGQGLATQLMNHMIEHARKLPIQRLSGDVLRSNTAMHRLMRSLGFKAEHHPDDPELQQFILELNPEIETSES